VRFALRTNRREFRVLGGLVAALYVLLCTVGALTHTHALPDAGLGTSSASVSPHTASAPSLSGQKGLHPPPVDCAYCEWQASSVSAALSPQSFSAPIAFSFDLPSPLTKVVSVPLLHTASRAPPLA